MNRVMALGGVFAVGEHAHRNVIFADAVDPARQMIFRPETRLQEAFDDFGVGEALLLRALAGGDGRDLRGKRLRP